MENRSELPLQTGPAAELLTALANENRLKVLCLLLESERSVTELGNAIGLAQSPLSQHLAKLRKLEIVGTRRDGQMVFYHLKSPAMRDMLHYLKQLFPLPG